MSRYLLRLFFLLVFIIVTISCNNGNVSKNNNTKIDSIEVYMHESKNRDNPLEIRKKNLKKAFYSSALIEDQKIRIEKTREISSQYYRLKDLENFKFYNDIILKISLSTNDSLNLAESYFMNGLYHRNSSNLITSYDNFFLAEKIYSSLEENKNIDPKSYAYKHGKALVDLGKILLTAKDYSESEDLTIKAIKKFNLSGNLRYIPQSYINLGIIAKHLERYEDAIKYYQRVIDYTKNTDRDTLYKIISYNNMGTVYKSQKKYLKAKKYYLKGLGFKKYLNKDLRRHALLLDNLGYAEFLANKENDSVLFLFNKAYRIRDSIKDIKGLSTNNLHYAEYYQAIGKDSLSKMYGEKSREISLELNINEELLQSYQILAQVSEKEEGLAYAMKHIKLTDSLVKQDNLFKDKFARIRFESENLQQENDEKQLQIIEVQNQNTIYFLGILLLITFIGFITYFSRQRTRYLSQQNKIVQFQTAYETETRISKRLHDELGNDIFQVMLQYQNDPKDPHIPEKLNTAYTKARDISRENNDFEVDETYPEEVSNMLQNYTQNGIQLILRGFDTMHWGDTDKTIKITVYRVLQELMTNMQKHSNASIVAIVFSNSNNILNIKYSDNGSGISQTQLLSKNGLRNTEKRIQAVNGTIIFDSEKDKGFKAEIKIPS